MKQLTLLTLACLATLGLHAALPTTSGPQVFSGPVTASSFTGDGASLTNYFPIGSAKALGSATSYSADSGTFNLGLGDNYFHWSPAGGFELNASAPKGFTFWSPATFIGSVTFRGDVINMTNSVSPKPFLSTYDSGGNPLMKIGGDGAIAAPTFTGNGSALSNIDVAMIATSAAAPSKAAIVLPPGTSILSGDSYLTGSTGSITRLGVVVGHSPPAYTYSSEPTVIFDTNTAPLIVTGTNHCFKMWHSMGGGEGYCESKDGLTWTADVLVVPGPYYEGNTLYANGTYHMFVSSNTVSVTHWTSPNGTNFSFSGTVIRTNPAVAWKALNVANVGVLYDAASPFPGTNWIMLFDGGPVSGQWKVGLAYSADGTTWYEYAGNPVLGSDSFGTTSCRPWKGSDGFYYTFSQCGVFKGTLLPSEIALYRSSDLVHWSVVNNGFPVIPRLTAAEGPFEDNSRPAALLGNASQTADGCPPVDLGNKTLFFWTSVSDQSYFTVSSGYVNMGRDAWTSSLTNSAVQTSGNVLNGPTRIGTTYHGTGLAVSILDGNGTLCNTSDNLTYIHNWLVPDYISGADADFGGSVGLANATVSSLFKATGEADLRVAYVTNLTVFAATAPSLSFATPGGQAAYLQAVPGSTYVALSSASRLLFYAGSNEAAEIDTSNPPNVRWFGNCRADGHYSVGTAAGLTTNINVIVSGASNSTNQLQFTGGILTGVVPQ